MTSRREWRTDEGAQVLASERPQGSFSRRLFLGDGLDLDRVEARYDDGVLTITIPVAEQAKPHKVAIAAGNNGVSCAAASAPSVASPTR